MVHAVDGAQLSPAFLLVDVQLEVQASCGQLVEEVVREFVGLDDFANDAQDPFKHLLLVIFEMLIIIG